MACLQSTNKVIAQVDDHLLGALRRFRWYATENGQGPGQYFIFTKIGNANVYLHRLVAGEPPHDKARLSFIDGDCHDARRGNLAWRGHPDWEPECSLVAADGAQLRVDRELIPLVERFRWVLVPSLGYCAQLPSTLLPLYLLVLGHPPDVLLSPRFLNGDPRDCRRKNLIWEKRPSVFKQAMIKNPAGWRGVRQEGPHGFSAAITVLRTSYNLGVYLTQREAALAYDQAALSIYGPEAKLNHPEVWGALSGGPATKRNKGLAPIRLQPFELPPLTRYQEEPEEVPRGERLPARTRLKHALPEDDGTVELDSTRWITTTNGHRIKVDQEVYLALRRHGWHGQEIPVGSGRIYFNAQIGTRPRVNLTHLVMGTPPPEGGLLLNLDGNALDLRRRNLAWRRAPSWQPPSALVAVDGTELRVDPEMEALVGRHRWFLVEGQGYCARVGSAIMPLAALVLGRPPKGAKEICFRDGDRAHCTRANLAWEMPEEAPRQGKKRTPPGRYGVRFRRPNYQARIVVAGENLFLGTFPTEKEAALAHDRAALHHFGERAVLNYPELSAS